MKATTGIFLGTLGALLFLGSAGAKEADHGNTAKRADGTLTEESLSISQPKMPVQTDKRLSSMAMRSLDHIASARKALANHDSIKARLALQKASGLLELIQADVPQIQIKETTDRITKRLDTEVIDTRTVIPDLIPIYTQLDLMTSYVPSTDVAAARNAADQAKESLRKQDKKNAILALNKISSAAFLTSAYMPVAQVAGDVDRALTSLDDKNMKLADNALRGAEQSIKVVTAEVSRKAE